MTVYLDVIWLLNFLFDTFLLYLTAIILKRSIRVWRLLAGGLIGSLIILLSFTPTAPITNHPASKLLFSVLMVLTVFGYQRWRFFIKGLFTLYFSTFLLGGILIGVHYFIQYDSELTAKVLLSNVKGFGDPISWLFVLLGFPVAWHFSKTRVESIEMTKIQYDQMVKVVLTIDQIELFFTGLVDSGNQLYDPITKMPVMIVSVKNNDGSLPDPIRKLAEEGESIVTETIDLPDEWQNRLRIVPCRVVGQEHQLIVAIKPDAIKIVKENEAYFYEKGLVSFTLQELSADGAFQCIVHPKMLTGQKLSGDAVKVS
ncbi:sigma-E processing peptidase SpoIIGA [Neobacillus sp. SM06]|uniref:sigma-E processing peptidase SpoIIGA n=1 Tax=Neobacillus sp. SM06 TaxID=3422492 RepID=UPI003D289B31